MPVKGLIRSVFGAAAVGGAVMFSQLGPGSPDAEAKPQKPESCAVVINKADMTKIRQTYLVASTTINHAIEKHNISMAQLDPGISEGTAAEKMKLADEVYGDFATKGLIKSDEKLWQDIRQGRHIAEIAQTNADFANEHSLPCARTSPKIFGQ